MQPISKPGSALLILGHGSTENPDSSHPTWELVDTIKKADKFSSVHAAFWKEEPSFRQVFAAIEEDEIYVVPNFISEGYFTREVLPRELELDGPTTLREGKTIRYCDPVGIHPSMTGLLKKRAKEILTEPISEDEDCAVIIVGHGTNLNQKSTEAIKTQVERMKEIESPFDEVLDAYMEEAPFISDWKELTSAHHVVVVPFFIADGLHSFQDIPVMLGLETEPTEAASQMTVFKENPRKIDDRLLYYTQAIGNDPSMGRVIIDQVIHFDENYLHAVA